MATTPKPLPPRPPKDEITNALAAAGVTAEPPVDVDAVEGPAGGQAGPAPPENPMGEFRRTRRFDGMPVAGDPDNDSAMPLDRMVTDDAVKREIIERWGADFEAKRIAFGSNGRRLPVYKKRPGFRSHIFNDYPGRIDAALAAGYKHVTDERGRNISVVVGTSQFGGALTGYLMEIPEEWFLKDMAAAQKEVDEVDQVILGGGVGAKEGDGRYVAGIKVKHGD